ncbi:MAG: hypothetical protein NT154_08805, partial [Verrucomicrobia bacterium]|nr:hypothetical protein [Verrucomicrobiota bacterium]
DTDADGVADYVSDADGNGLGDSWEQQYFGHTSVDPYDDPDGDWLTNYQEWLGNSNPLDRMVVAWGVNNYGQCNVPLGLRNVVGLAGGMDHSLALLADGEVAVWGGQQLWPDKRACEPDERHSHRRCILPERRVEGQRHDHQLG